MKLIWVIPLLAALAAARPDLELLKKLERRQDEDKYVSTCNIGGPPQNLNFFAGAWFNLFLGMPFDCDGVLDFVEYYAQQSGVFYVGVWRPVGDDDFMLIGKIRIWAMAPGYDEYTVPMGERIGVQSGDVIGIHLDRQASDDRGGIIPYEDSRNDDTISGTQLFSIYNSNHRNEDFYIGKTMTFTAIAGVTRAPALRAYIGDPGTDTGVVMEIGYEPGPAEELDGWSNAIYVTDPSQSASSDGTLVSWELYVQNVGVIYLQVWRSLDYNEYSLVGQTKVNPTKVGPMHVELTGNQRIDVKEGDTLGIYFPEGSVVPFKKYNPCNEYNAFLYYEPSYSYDGPSVWDTVYFETSMSDWGACRRYSYNARIMTDVVSTPMPPVLPTGGTGGGGGGGGGGLSGSCGTPAITPQTRQSRIVGGNPAIPHSWPWMVSLQSSGGSHFCGGSLVAPGWVVTAAHCMPGWDSSNEVVVGRHSAMSTSSVEERVMVDQVISHESYDDSTHANDIALLKLSHNVMFRDEISAVCLPEKNQEYSGGTLCYTTGWGDTAFWGSSPEVLLQVGVPIVDEGTCNSADYYDGQITNSMICAGLEQGGKDSCQGDSGGPFVCSEDGVWKLAGVVSWGRGCADAKKPGVYAKTSIFVDWINEKIAENS